MRQQEVQDKINNEKSEIESLKEILNQNKNNKEENPDKQEEPEEEKTNQNQPKTLTEEEQLIENQI